MISGANIFQGFSGFQGMLQVGMYILYGIVALVVAGLLTVAVLFIVVKAKEKAVVELGAVTRTMNQFAGKDKKQKGKLKHLFVGGKSKKYLPNVQQEDIFMRGKKEYIFLMKDNNGLHHFLRLPSFEEIKKWYKVVYDIDLDEIRDRGGELSKKEREFLNVVGTVYMMPSPSEDMEWLADQAAQSDNQFASGILKHPAMVWAATIAVCAFVFIITIIISKRM